MTWQSFPVFILTFDEYGGLYDHVPPQRTVSPDGIKQVNFLLNYAIAKLLVVLWAISVARYRNLFCLWRACCVIEPRTGTRIWIACWVPGPAPWFSRTHDIGRDRA